MMMKVLMIVALFGAAAADAGDCADGAALANADPDGTEDACDTCVGAATYSIPPNAGENDLAHAIAGCLPDPVIGSCTGAESAECTACISIVVSRDVTLVSEDDSRDAALAAAIAAACEMPVVVAGSCADQDALIASDLSADTPTACDTCAAAAVAIWDASGSTNTVDLGQLQGGCYPDPVIGSCTDADSAECTACRSTVVSRDATLLDEDYNPTAAYAPAVAAACEMPVVVAGSCADQDALIASDLSADTPTACDTCAAAATAIWGVSDSTDATDLAHAIAGCLPDPVIGSCTDADLSDAATEVSAECTACISIVVSRDTTLVSEDDSRDAALAAAVAAACGTPVEPAKASSAGAAAASAAALAAGALLL